MLARRPMYSCANPLRHPPLALFVLYAVSAAAGTRSRRMSGGCVDDETFVDGDGNKCKDYTPEMCRKADPHREYGGRTPHAACCKCVNLRHHAVPPDARVPHPLAPGEGCPVRRPIKYPFCPMLVNLPTDVSTGGKVACDFRLDTMNYYLPSPRLLKCLEEQPPSEWEADRNRMHRVINALQNPKDCRRPWTTFKRRPRWEWNVDTSVFVPSDPGELLTGFHVVRPVNFGLAVSLWYFTWLIGNHWDRGMPVITTQIPQRFYGDDCGTGWSCYFTRLTRCALRSPDDDPETMPKDSTNTAIIYQDYVDDWAFTSYRDVCRPHGKWYVQYGRCLCDPGFTLSHSTRHKCGRVSPGKADYRGSLTKMEWLLNRSRRSLEITAVGEHDPFRVRCPSNYPIEENDPEWKAVRPSLKERHGWLWWHGAVLTWLLNGAPARQPLDRWTHDIGLREGCVAIHIRRGDACRDVGWRKCFRTLDYVEAADILMRTYALRPQVYVATDGGESIFEEIEDRRPQWEVIRQQLADRDKYNKPSVFVENNPALDGPHTGLETHRDLWGLSKCAALVGTGGSGFTLLSYELMIHRHGHYRPFISLDHPLLRRTKDQDPTIGNKVHANVRDYSHSKFQGHGTKEEVWDQPPRPPEDFLWLTGERELLSNRPSD
eukprot:TRINITY_DN3639_c0_g1_i1.p1 TRINITY_DN3639_c0_g1~~TRINITY_DN3639_c0_g1_i1.p1  ORF type:complete len:690 (+),score=109.67 TRINITY_DN3639_c0_g1_i1:99-2072(+)